VIVEPRTPFSSSLISLRLAKGCTVAPGGEPLKINLRQEIAMWVLGLLWTRLTFVALMALKVRLSRSSARAELIGCGTMSFNTR
jgi:hypothetical protein